MVGIQYVLAVIVSFVVVVVIIFGFEMRSLFQSPEDDRDRLFKSVQVYPSPSVSQPSKLISSAKG